MKHDDKWFLAGGRRSHHGQQGAWILALLAIGLAQVPQ